ncbi:MAG: dihydropyrimidinase, partial [Ilumatobacteraceae bacterium]
MTRTLITNGTVISSTGQHLQDVLIEGEKIVAVLESGQAQRLNIVADRVIDATGKYVVPGGIDVHTHMELPFGGTA